MHGCAVARSWAPTFRPRSRAPEHVSLSPRPPATPHPSPLPAGTWGGRNTRDHSAVGSCNPHRGAHPSARALPLGLSCSFSAVTLTLLSVATGHFCCNVRVSEPAAISFSFLLFLGCLRMRLLRGTEYSGAPRRSLLLKEIPRGHFRAVR